MTPLMPTLSGVRALYEAYPYPCYPLLATPRWQDGYLTHSRFAACVAGAGAWRGTGGGSNRVLIGGGGEILPYIIRKWEPRGQAVISIDLSRHSTRRARWRTLFSSKSTRFLRGDLDAYLLREPPGLFAHIDAYGVLHHMPNPSHTLALMAKALAPGGTLRVMVYNSPARTWIHHVQRLLASPLLGIDRFLAADLRLAREILGAAAKEAPALAVRLNQLGAGTMPNDGRFADTFLHPREARLGIRHWLEAIRAAGLEVVGLFDRYCELDDLENPLSVVPSIEALEQRAADGRYENNLELFIRRPRGTEVGEVVNSRPCKVAGTETWIYRLKPPPGLWFSYDETRQISWGDRQALWQAHLDWVLCGEARRTTPLLPRLSKLSLQRLLRLGAILPGQIVDTGLRRALAAPMTAMMEAPLLPAAVELRGGRCEGLIRSVLVARGRGKDGVLRQVMARLDAAQR